MKKAAVLFMSIMGALPALGSSFDNFAGLATPEATIELEIQNTTELSDNQLLGEILAVLKTQPQNFADKETHVCVGQTCEILDSMDFLQIQVETIGIKETIQPSQFARDVGAVVGQAVGGVHGSATVKVKYSETNKKSADGSTENSKTVDVSVTVTAGKK